MVNACSGPALDYVSTDFGVESSNRLPFRAHADRQTHVQTDATDSPIPTNSRSTTNVYISALLVHYKISDLKFTSFTHSTLFNTTDKTRPLQNDITDKQHWHQFKDDNDSDKLFLSQAVIDTVKWQYLGEGQKWRYRQWRVQTTKI